MDNPADKFAPYKALYKIYQANQQITKDIESLLNALPTPPLNIQTAVFRIRGKTPLISGRRPNRLFAEEDFSA